MTYPNGPIRSIVIVGGGTAGWSAAACLSQYLDQKDCTITLIESSEIGTVGVGEASIPNIHNFNSYVGLDERSFIKQTNGTFKLGIEFAGWSHQNASFFHPFGGFGVPFRGMGFHQCLGHIGKGGSSEKISNYSVPIALARQGKFAQPLPNKRSPLTDYGYAFHFDAGQYAAALKDIAIGRGVQNIDSRINGVQLIPEKGFIECLHLADGSTVHADFFVDCSGFRSLLLGEALGVEYESWQRWLPCNRAIALPSSRENNTIEPYTTATAQHAGWTWRIPLQNRYGNGYVYSSHHLTDDEALDALQSILGVPSQHEPNRQRFEAGMRQNFWSKNCVALGLSGGFIEPLESTSINLVHRGLSTLMDFFPDRTFDPRLERAANRVFCAEQKNIRDFIILHYKMSKRRDTSFWRSVTEAEIPVSLSDKIDAYNANGTILQYEAESFKPESWLAIYDGLGTKPDTIDLRTDGIDPQEIINGLIVMKRTISEAVSSAPTHAEFISKNGLSMR